MSPGRLDRLRASLKPRPRRPPAGPPVPAPGPLPAAVPGPVPAELEGRRVRLQREYADLQSDLGGLVYEMAIRDSYRLDVVTRQAAKLQAVDVQLTEVERAIHAVAQPPALIQAPPPAVQAPPAAPAPPPAGLAAVSSPAQAAATTATCPACGQAVEPGAGFCGSCGAAVGSVPPPTGAQPAGL